MSHLPRSAEPVNCRGCAEETLNENGWCRDCDIERSLDHMQCSVCTRMRYRTDLPWAELGAALWGDPCTCNPKPPSMLQVKGGAW